MDRLTAERLYDAGKEPTVKKLLAQDAEINRLNERIAGLAKNSSNSSKPPSTDIVKPQRQRDKKKRKKGGQKGHPRWERRLFLVCHYRQHSLKFPL